MAGSSGTHVTVDGRTIRLTSLDKVLYPETGTTKGDVVAYYRAVAPWFVAHSSRRPATRKRWVDGVGTAADPAIPFFSKNLDSGTPDWVATTTLEHEHRDAVYPLVDDEATLVWMAQIAALELHVPQWRVGARGGHRNPDRLVLDLDPGEGAGLPECVQAAHLCREILDGMGLAPVPVTSGSKGIHLYAALDGRTTTAGATRTYRPGARGRTWIKIKNVRTQEVVVAGWTPGSGRRSGSLGALLLAVQDEEGLAYAGKVGTGFTTTSLEDILAKVQRLERKTPALEGVPRAEARDAHWVTPKLVGEVAYAEWTSAGRLRHPTWRGWRVDKDADEVWRSDG